MKEPPTKCNTTMSRIDSYFRKHLQKGGQGSWGKMGCDSRRFSDRYLR